MSNKVKIIRLTARGRRMPKRSGVVDPVGIGVAGSRTSGPALRLGLNRDPEGYETILTIDDDATLENLHDAVTRVLEQRQRWRDVETHWTTKPPGAPAEPAVQVVESSD